MFEGMSDDEDDFQSVSHSARYSTSDIVYMRSDGALGANSVCLNVCNRGAQQVPPTEQEAQRESDRCL